MTPSASHWSEKWKSLSWIVYYSIGLAAAALVLANWRIATDVEIELSTRIVRFSFNLQDPTLLAGPNSKSDLTLRGFSSLRMPPAKYSSLTTLARIPKTEYNLELVPNDYTLSQVTIESQPGDSGKPHLGRIYARTGAVTFSVPETGSYRMSLKGSVDPFAIGIPDRFRLEIDSCRPFDSPAVVLNGTSGARRNRQIEVKPSGEWLLVDMKGDLHPATPLLQPDLPITTIEFFEQSSLGGPSSGLIGPGTINYMGVPGIPEVKLVSGDFLSLQDLDRLTIRRLELHDSLGYLRVFLKGKAGVITAGPALSQRDQRLSIIDYVFKNRSIAQVIGLLLWFGPVAVATRKHLREIQ